MVMMMPPDLIRLSLLVSVLEKDILYMPVSGRLGDGHYLSKYAGNVTITNGGRTCQMWTSQTPHIHHFDKNYHFPLDGTAKDAANFCRNLDGDSTPWCYTIDPRKRWDYCDRPILGEPTCSGILSEPTGLLMWPDTDGGDVKYYNDLDCLWSIVAPEKMLIDFEVLQLDSHSHRICAFDFLAIYDDTRHYGRYCGTTTPPRIRSSSNTLYIRFYIDSENSPYPSFTASYSHVDNGDETIEEPGDYPLGDIMCSAGVDIGLYTGNVHVTDTGRSCKVWLYAWVSGLSANHNFCRNLAKMFPFCKTTDGTIEYCTEVVCKGSPCGGQVRTPFGWLSGVDGDHDGNYDISRECLWTIMAPENHVIVVQLLYLSINDRKDCEDEKLLIYETISEAETFCGNLSAASLPITLRFNSSQLFVFFKSADDALPGPGFNLSYVQVNLATTEATPSQTATTSMKAPTTEPLGVTHTSDNLQNSTTSPDSGSTERIGNGCIKMSISNIIYVFKITAFGLIGLLN